MSTEKISKGSFDFEGESDKENDEYDCDKIPLVPSGRNLNRKGSDFGFDFNRWMRKYVEWTDERPMFSRSVVSAITASIGVLLARATTTGSSSKVPLRNQNRQQPRQHNGIDILEMIAFAVHGGLVAGPLSYHM